jgi:hypothetical protein
VEGVGVEEVGGVEGVEEFAEDGSFDEGPVGGGCEAVADGARDRDQGRTHPAAADQVSQGPGLFEDLAPGRLDVLRQADEVPSVL